MKLSLEQDSVGSRYVRVGIVSSKSLYPCSEENLVSKVGIITPIEQSTTWSADADEPNRTRGSDVGGLGQFRDRD
jgi:hypothetical protein